MPKFRKFYLIKESFTVQQLRLEPLQFYLAEQKILKLIDQAEHFLRIQLGLQAIGIKQLITIHKLA